jgi:glutaredoxin
MESYTLYQFPSCPFCQRVLRFLRDNRIELPMRDVLTDDAAHAELVAGGGSSQVPCLRIERSDGVHWLYESLDIIDYLRERCTKSAM